MFGLHSALRTATVVLTLCLMAVCCRAQEQRKSEEELAKQLANPVARLISVPFQLNYDDESGPDDGNRLLLNIQPVIPFDFNERWNLISRTILPIVSQNDVLGNSGSQLGFGDTLQSLFLSPKAATPGGLIWGAGLVFLIPTGTDDLLGSRKWGIGPTIVALKQDGGWTAGILMNHVWSIAGSDRRADVSSTFLQPFLSFTTPKAITYSVNTESTYDWENEQWSIPVNLTVARLTHFGDQKVSIGGGVRYWVDSPDNGPEGLGVRLTLTYLFPR